MDEVAVRIADECAETRRASHLDPSCEVVLRGPPTGVGRSPIAKVPSVSKINVFGPSVLVLAAGAILVAVVLRWGGSPMVLAVGTGVGFFAVAVIRLLGARARSSSRSGRP